MSDLIGARDHYRKMADPEKSPETPPPERELWTRLADEIDDYLAREYDESTPEGAALW